MQIILKSFIFSLLVLVTTNCNSQSATKAGEETVSFKVWGNCEMCQETIEAALDVKGVKKAKWNIDTKIIKVTYLSGKINEDKIHQLIAAEGYDTEKVKGDDKAYASLPDCCRYERKK